VAGGLTLAEGPAPPAASPDAGVGDVDHDQPPPEAQPDPATNLSIPVRARAQISVAEMNEQVEKYFQKMDEILKRMVDLQEIARREKDVIKLNCVNDKLLQLKQLMNIADQAKTNMQEAIARGDEDSRYHEFGRITIAQQQAQALASEAENCVGEDLTFLGPTQVIIEEPELPDDPTVVIGPDFPVVEPLPVASPQA
jgi:hypothetical protein